MAACRAMSPSSSSTGRASGRTPRRSPGAGPGGRRRCRARGARASAAAATSDHARADREPDDRDRGPSMRRPRRGSARWGGPASGSSDAASLSARGERPEPAQRLIGQPPLQLLLGAGAGLGAVEPPDRRGLGVAPAPDGPTEPAGVVEAVGPQDRGPRAGRARHERPDPARRPSRAASMQARCSSSPRMHGDRLRRGRRARRLVEQVAEHRPARARPRPRAGRRGPRGRASITR